MATKVKPGKRPAGEKYSSLKSAAFREQMHIGAAIADALPKFMEAKECAKALGISTTMLRRIECRALYTVRTRMLEIMKGIRRDDS